MDRMCKGVSKTTNKLEKNELILIFKGEYLNIESLFLIQTKLQPFVLLNFSFKNHATTMIDMELSSPC